MMIFCTPGVPPMTGTATLNIIVSDDNDNAPSLTENNIAMCQSEGPAQATITALDLDEDPHGGPFHFRLHGDIMGKWKIDPNQGKDQFNLFWGAPQDDNFIHVSIQCNVLTNT